MLVVEPNSSRFEASQAGVSTNEHLLERISATENRITRLAERLERGLDLVLGQAQNSYFDRSLVKALVDVLAEDGLINKDRLEKALERAMSEGRIAQTENSHESTVSRKTAPLSKKRSTKCSRR